MVYQLREREEIVAASGGARGAGYRQRRLR